MNIHMTLEKKFSDKKYVMRGESYSGLEWLDSSPKPKEAELESAWQDIVNDKAVDDVKKAAYDSALSAGYDTGMDFKLSVSEYAQTRFAVIMTGLKNLAPSNETEVTIWDQKKVKHVITYAQFKTIMQGYTLHCIGMEQ